MLTWSAVFFAKAIYNWVATTLLFFTDEPLREWLGEEPSNPLYLHLFLAHGFAFGIGFWIVGMDTTRNHGIVLLGFLTQLALFVTVAVHTARGRAHPLRMAFGLVDFVFAVLFAVFLWL